MSEDEPQTAGDFLVMGARAASRAAAAAEEAVGLAAQSIANAERSERWTRRMAWLSLLISVVSLGLAVWSIVLTV